MTCYTRLLKSFWLNYTYTFKLYKLSSLSLSRTAFRHTLPSFDEIIAYLNYRALHMFRLNGLGENCFVQPTSPQRESVYHSKATAAAQKLEQQLVEKGCRCGSWDRSRECVFGECETLSSTNGCLQAVSLIVFTQMKHAIVMSRHKRKYWELVECVDFFSFFFPQEFIQN